MFRYFCLLAATILFQFPLMAQFPGPEVHKEWEFSLFGGASFLDDGTFLTPVEGLEIPRNVGIDYDSGYLVGVRVTQNLGRHLGAELEYSFANQPLGFQDIQPSLPALDLDQRIHSILYNILIYPLDRSSRWRPYGSIGGGTALYQLDPDSEIDALNEGLDLKDQWKFAFAVGGGLKYMLHDQWGVRFDVRDQITGVPDYGLPRTAEVDQGEIGPALRPQGNFHNWQVSLGLIYGWSRR